MLQDLETPKPEAFHMQTRQRCRAANQQKRLRSTVARTSQEEGDSALTSQISDIPAEGLEIFQLMLEDSIAGQRKMAAEFEQHRLKIEQRESSREQRMSELEMELHRVEREKERERMDFESQAANLRQECTTFESRTIVLGKERMDLESQLASVRQELSQVQSTLEERERTLADFEPVYKQVCSFGQSLPRAVRKVFRAPSEMTEDQALG